VSEAGERGNQTPDHASRRAEEERGDMLSSRSEDEVGALPRRDPRGARAASGAIKHRITRCKGVIRAERA
jgi:hypothetical protein